MIYNEVAYQQLRQLSHTDQAYLNGDPGLMDFYSYEADLDAFAAAIGHRKKFPVDRRLLWEVLKDQYSGLSVDVPVEEKDILSDNTFFITTAHQPVLLTGPLFHIYKIASAIHLARELNKA